MTRTQRLGIAAAAVGLLVALAALFAHQRAPSSGSAATGPWLAGLKEALGEVRRVDLASSTSRASLRREGDSWGVAERQGYPVDRERLGDLLKALAAARVLEQKTSKPEFFGRLGLEDIDKPGSSAVLVEIWRDDSGPAWRVIVGNAAEGRSGRYLRLADANETWLVDSSPQAFADPADWIDRRVLGLGFERVAGVTRSLADGSGFEASRPDPAAPSLSVASLPEGTRPRYDSVFDAAARAVLTAEAEDVRKAGDDLFAGSALARNRIRFFDGLTLDVDAVKASDGNWIRVRASGVAPAAAAEQGSEKPPLQDPAAEAAAIEARLTGWAFKVSDYIYGELAKRLEEYTEAETVDEGEADDSAS